MKKLHFTGCCSEMSPTYYCVLSCSCVLSFALNAWRVFQLRRAMNGGATGVCSSSFVAVAGSPRDGSSSHRRRSQQMRSRSESARGQRRSSEEGAVAAAAAGRQLSSLKEDVRHWEVRRLIVFNPSFSHRGWGRGAR